MRPLPRAFVAHPGSGTIVCMPLSPEAIKDFQAIYRQEFGAELADAEAEAMAQELLQLFTLPRPLPSAHARTCPLHCMQPPCQPAS